MKWYKYADGFPVDSAEMSAYANVYDEAGRAVIVAEPVLEGQLMRVLQKAYYEHGLQNPDYAVFQSKELAVHDAEERSGDPVI